MSAYNCTTKHDKHMSKTSKTIEQLGTMLGIEGATITMYRNAAGDRIVAVNGKTAFNFESFWNLQSGDAKRMMESAYNR